MLEIGSGNNPNPRSDVLCDRYIHDNSQRAGEFAAVIDRPMVVADGYRLPFKNKSFDYVICSHILEHMKNPTMFLKEVTRVGRAGYVEVPSAISERIFGWDFHVWYCEKKGNTLVLRKKNEGEQFGGFFHRLIARHIWFRRFFEAHDHAWYVRMEWRGTVRLRIVDTVPDDSWLQALDRIAWRLMQKAEPDVLVDALFYVRWMLRRIGRKIRKEWKRGIWYSRRTLFPESLAKELLPFLQCPACTGELVLQSGTIRCVRCRSSYHHEQGIPILLS